MSDYPGLSLLTDGEIDRETVVDEYRVSLQPESIGWIYLISLGTVLIATVVPMVYIVRLKPRKILM